MWKDVLKQIDREHGLKAKFQEANLRVTLENESEIILIGVDSNQDDMEKIRGQRLVLAVLDEASTYRINVFQLINKILRPALWDFQGTLAMIGTPTDFVKSYFAQASTGELNGWTNHTWTAADNPHIRTQYLADIEEERAKDPDVDHKAWFQQEYLGKWVISEENRIFHYNKEDIWTDMPARVNPRYNLGISVGERKSSFTIIAHTSKLREAFIVKTVTILTADLTRILKTITRLEREFGEFDDIIMDGVTPKLIDEIGSRFEITTPEESEKDLEAIIRLFKTELLQNNIKVFSKCADIVEEWDSIVLDDRPAARARLEIHPSCPSLLTRAALHAWFKCYNYTYEPEVDSDDPNDIYWAQYAERINNPGTTDSSFESGGEVQRNPPKDWWYGA